MQSFTGDEDIFKYFDPTANVKTYEDVVENVVDKLFGYTMEFDCQYFPIDQGYVFTAGRNVLISFGLSPDRRNRDGLDELWGTIRANLDNRFYCSLWAKNTRAIQWLKKHGMVIDSTIEHEGHEIITLCHLED